MNVLHQQLEDVDIYVHVLDPIYVDLDSKMQHQNVSK